MTQKELLYLEDAVGHEQNIISIVENFVKKIEDERLVEFMNQELEKHNTNKQNLMNLLEECANE